jgi:2',3'-cyclic-nucleotide 2'-phosphodiesterase (5'-nucleotidase family)
MIVSDNDQRFTYNTYAVKNKTAHDEFVTHAGNKGTMLGRIDISFNEQGEKINMTAKQIFTGINGHDSTVAFRKHATTLV